MTQELRRLAGDALMVGLSGPRLDSREAERLELLAPCGVILFRRNLESVDQTLALLGEIRRRLGPEVILAVDQEGGRVSRLAPWVGPTPSAAALAPAGAPAVRRFACAVARALRALGIGLDFAPVVDLCRSDAPNGIGDRSFGEDPEEVSEEVSRLAGAFLAGLQAEGVAGCLKHFPGLGDTAVDTHVDLAVSGGDRERLERHLVPYRRLGGEAACVMVGHGHYPALDPSPRLPASLSARVVRDLLRDELAFRGLIVSDDLEMGAVRAHDAGGAAAVAAVDAGCDLLLYCSALDRAEAAWRALIRRATDDACFAERLASASHAVRRFARAWPAPAGGPEAWEAACSGLARAARLA
jgi:beta-N-acetylhexosaminidase